MRIPSETVSRPAHHDQAGSASVGVFLSQLEDAYQTEIWRGIEARARQRRIGVTCFVGPGRQSSEDASDVPSRRNDVAFQIAAPPAFDGLIALTTTIDALPPAAAIHQLPRISLGLKVDGLASITVDGAPGLESLVRHLIQVHGRRRFAMITGPRTHRESQEREQAIRRALASEGLSLDERLVVGGTFYDDSGFEGVQKLLNSGLVFDVVMALNDRMAIGAIQALKEAGKTIPEEIAVTGFDDIEQGRHVSPPLTTIDQPLETMGSLAVDLVLDLIEGRPVADQVLSCHPIFRWSCGCQPRTTDFWGPVPVVPQDTSPWQPLEALLTAGGDREFLSSLSRILETQNDGEVDFFSWIDGLEARGLPLPAVPLAEAGRRLASEMRWRTQAARRHQVVDRFRALKDLSAWIAGAFGRDALIQRLEGGWKTVGINRGFLVLFEHLRPGEFPVQSRLVLPRDDEVFSTFDLLPSRWGRPWTQGQWILEPLIYQEEPLGYLLLEATADEPSVYGALRDQVASTLKGTLLMEALRDHERSLEAEVARRTLELTQTNQELTLEVRRRLELERQVREISDETMRRIGQDLHDDLCQHLAGVAMLASVVRRNLPEAAEGAGPSLDRIGSLLQDSIIRARQIARGLYPPGLEERGLADALEELVATARLTSPALLLYETEGDCHGGSLDRRLQLFRIVQESLTNALKHSGTDVVRIRLARDPDGGITASVTDFGSGGIPSAGGPGLGLGIMRYRAETAGLELRFEALEPGLRVVCRWPPEEVIHG